MIAAIRLRGSIKVGKAILDTMRILKLDRVNTLSIVDDSPSVKGMIKKVENFITWGEISEDAAKKLGGKKVVRLHPLRGGMRSVKKKYPKGDLGYRGAGINELIEKMIQ